MPSAEGFTLIEALVAMAVIAILVAVAVPAWSHAKAAADSGAVRSDLAASPVGRRAPLGPCWQRRRGVPGGWQRADAADPPTGTLAGSSSPISTATGSSAPTRPGWYSARRSQGCPFAHYGGRTRLVFQPNGGSAGSNVTFTLCDARGIGSATTLVLSNGGSFRAGSPTATAAWNCVYGQ
jgi:type IV fimbrial biogenesis protein FimT